MDIANYIRIKFTRTVSALQNLVNEVSFQELLYCCDVYFETNLENI